MLQSLFLSLTTKLCPTCNSDKACSLQGCAFLVIDHGTSRPTSQTFTQKKTHTGSIRHRVHDVNVCVAVK